MVLWCFLVQPTADKIWKRFLKEKDTRLSSEFDADSQYVIMFGKYHGSMNDLIPTLFFISLLYEYTTHNFNFFRENS
jgi:hypothetical protein